MNLQAFLDDFMNNDDLKLLAHDAGELFDCPLMIVDVAFRALAWHRPAEFDDLPFKGSVDRGSLTYETSSFLAGCEAGAQYVTLRDSPYERRFSQLVTGGAPVGYLILVDVKGALRSIAPQEFAAVESALAKQVSLEINRGGTAADSSEAVLTSLLEGRFTDEALFNLQVGNAGLSQFAPKRMAVVNLELYRSTTWSENALRGTLLDIFPQSRPLMHNGGVVFFLNSEPDIGLFQNLSAQFSLRIVVSAPIESLFRLPKVYASACGIMEFLLPRTPGPFAVTAEPFHALMMVRRLMDSTDLALPAVRALARHDREEQTEYCLTLYTYLCCHHSLQETCAALFTHRNTVLYRIHRMKEDFDIPIDDPAQHLALAMSAAMMLMNLGQEKALMPGNRD